MLLADSLPFESPTESKSLIQAVIDRSTLGQNAKPSLSRTILCDRNAVTDGPGTQRPSVEVPVLSSQGCEQTECQTAGMGFGERSGPMFWDSHHRPSDTSGRTKTMNAPQHGSRSRSREVTSRGSPAVEEEFRRIERRPVQRSETARNCNFTISRMWVVAMSLAS